MSIRRILNLGAGTQSSVLLVMCDRGELEPVEEAIFSDTQSEPLEVYEHLEWLSGVGYEKFGSNPSRWRAIPGSYRGGVSPSTTVRVVTAGNLEEDAIAFRQNRFSENSSTGRKGYASIPLFILNGDGSQGIVRRQCTSEYKLKPIYDYIRKEMLGLGKGNRVPNDVFIQQVFGISFDERTRMRIPDAKWQMFDYPLVDMKLTRWAVIAKAEQMFPDHPFPRSACVFCPYKSNEEWRRLRDEHPEDWQRAVSMDHAMRLAESDYQTRPATKEKLGGRLVGLPFVHRQMVPLDEADLRSNDEKSGQMTIGGFANECEGMCGV